MKSPALPTQLAANNMVATEIAGASAKPSAGPAVSALQTLVGAVESALHRVDPKGADRAAIALLADWHDILSALKSDVSAMLHDLGERPVSGTGLLEGLRDMLGGHGVKALVADGTRMLDRLHDTIDRMAAPEAIATMERHRAAIVALVNRAQDRLDA